MIKDRQYSIDQVAKAFLSLKPYLVDGATKGRKTILPSRRVFIVHGKDEKNKDSLRDMLSRWGFEPIILAEQPNRGRVLIEKLLDHTSDVGFVFVLMAPDDVGSTEHDYYDFLGEITMKDYTDNTEGLVNISPFKYRVRQNVIFEYGLCIGSLGRERVCVLLGGDRKTPSDLLGYGYTQFKDNVSECKQKIELELKAVGYGPREEKPA